MTYFPNRPEEEQPYQPLFHEPVPDALEDAIAEAEAEEAEEEAGFDEADTADAETDTDWREETDEDRREELLARRDFFRASAWVRDLVLVIVFTVISLLLIWLIVSMIHMTVEDLQSRFTVLQNLGGGTGGDRYG